jgi:hypothetical protein
VPAAELLAGNCNLDRKNPRIKEDIAHLPPGSRVALWGKISETVIRKSSRSVPLRILSTVSSIFGPAS